MCRQGYREDGRVCQIRSTQTKRLGRLLRITLTATIFLLVKGPRELVLVHRSPYPEFQCILYNTGLDLKMKCMQQLSPIGANWAPPDMCLPSACVVPPLLGQGKGSCRYTEYLQRASMGDWIGGVYLGCPDVCGRALCISMVFGHDQGVPKNGTSYHHQAL